jgi:hypothetical protein
MISYGIPEGNNRHMVEELKADITEASLKKN